MKVEEIGHYGRTYSGRILKYVNVESINNIWTRREVIDNRITNTISEEIVKSSKDLIGLIEAKDLVNGYPVLDRFGANQIILDINTSKWGIKTILDNKDIKTVVTHQQLAEIEYRVEEKQWKQ